jgi:hypothetical protein
MRSSDEGYRCENWIYFPILADSSQGVRHRYSDHYSRGLNQAADLQVRGLNP